MGSRAWFHLSVFCFIVYGSWSGVYSLLFTDYGLWFMVYGLWFMVHALVLLHRQGRSGKAPCQPRRTTARPQREPAGTRPLLASSPPAQPRPTPRRRRSLPATRQALSAFPRSRGAGSAAKLRKCCDAMAPVAPRAVALHRAVNGHRPFRGGHGAHSSGPEHVGASGTHRGLIPAPMPLPSSGLVWTTDTGTLFSPKNARTREQSGFMLEHFSSTCLPVPPVSLCTADGNIC